jgi:hypothetical protein
MSRSFPVRPTRLEWVSLAILVVFLPLGVVADVCAGRSLLGAALERGWYVVAIGWLWFLSVQARVTTAELRELRAAVDRKPVGMRVELVSTASLPREMQPSSPCPNCGAVK